MSNERSAGTPVRVLILTAPVGAGHVAAARAVASGIRRQNADAEVVVLDVLPALPRLLRWLLSDAYRWQLNAAPWLFGLSLVALWLSAPWLFALQQRELKNRGQQPLAVLIEAIPGMWPALATSPLRDRSCKPH